MKKILQRIDTSKGRAYVLVRKNEKPLFFPSVTSILSLKSSSYLTDLEEKIGKDRLRYISERAAKRGTAMHLFLENYMICMAKKGNPDSCLLYTQRKSTDALLHEMDKDRVDVGRALFYNVYHSGIFDKIKKVIFTEKFLHSEKFLFAGTTDFGFLDTDNYIVITDYKSASFSRDEETLDKYKIQVAAYTIAFEEMYNKPVHRGEVWISHEDTLQIVSVSGEEMKKKKEEFLALCESYHSTWDTSPFEEYFKLDI
jgi:CRISPR/Cas system-associated exonuclease Cas4 (RecB family)